MADDFKTYVRAAGETLDGTPGPCPRDEELMEYHRGVLSVTRQEEVQAHVVHCAICRETLQTGAAFFEPAVHGAVPAIDADIGAEWAKINAIIGRNERPVSQRYRVPLAAAAALIVSIAGLLAWNVSLQTRMTSERSARLKLEQDSRHWQDELSTLRSARLVPSVNLGVHDVFPNDTLARSGRSLPSAVVPSAPSAAFALLLSGAGQPEYPEYALEIADAANRPVWSAGGLRRDVNRNYTILIPPGFLAPGDYVLNIFGIRGTQRKHLSLYKVRVN